MDETAKGTDGRKEEERRVYSMHFTPRILIEEDPMEPESDGPSAAANCIVSNFKPLKAFLPK